MCAPPRPPVPGLPADAPGPAPGARGARSTRGLAAGAAAPLLFAAAFAATFAAGLVARPAAPRAQDPFAAGPRWRHAAPPAVPWIPRDVALAGGGELLWSAASVGAPHVGLYATAELADPAQPLLADHGYAGAIGPVLVAAGDGLDELFALVQLPAPTSATRRTLVRAYDATSAPGGAAFAPRWTHELGTLVDGGALLAAGAAGTRVVAAAVDTGRGEVELRWIDGASGALVAERRLAGGSLRALAVAAGGARVALVGGGRLLVLDEGSPLPLLELPLALPTEALALSPDGRRLVVGDGGEVRVLVDTLGGFAPALVRAGLAGEMAVRAALSDDGAVLAVGWWDAVRGDGVRIEVLRVAGGTVENEVVQSGGGGLQNFPAALDVSADGARVAVGLWGAEDARPELLLLGTGRPQPLLALDLGGSVLALELDARGTRVGLGRKHAHANHFGTTGEVLLVDTGERDLQLLGAARPGGVLGLALLAPEPGLAVFGVGLLAPAPLRLPALGGWLWLDPGGPLGFWSAPAAASGAGARADLALSLAPDASLVGLPLAAQAASIGSGGAVPAATCVRPAVF